ncbi:GIY-YIG nuclease family protein [Altererythrobacter salegens]|uniref:GIY-YIG nuclease family protein n=1 Tax=Croceibacterium salegens TaxID=1737568 RepID=A0A6I4SSX2_9SPHN|nr:GIY-YIG nuclease family protein [Croceibacterium salegens]
MKREFQPAVYIVANRRNGAIYTGVTSDLVQRIWQHREGVADGFTKQYGCKMLVWYESHSTMEYAILREKQIKGGPRRRKLELIEQANLKWRGLYAEICA